MKQMTYTMYLDRPTRDRKKSRSELYHTYSYPFNGKVSMVGRGKATNELCGSFHSGWKHETESMYIIKKHHCNHLHCPICYSEAIGLRAFSATSKLKLYARAYRNLIFQHISLNFIEKEITLDNFYDWWNEKGRKKYNKIAKSAGIDGGIIILHCWRIDKEKEGVLRFSPHLHVLGSGYLLNSAKFKEKFGFTYRQHKKRFITQLDATFAYLLNHATLLEGKQTVRHFGVVANNKFKVEKESREIRFPFRKLMDDSHLDLNISDTKVNNENLKYFRKIKGSGNNLYGGWFSLKMWKISHLQYKLSQTIRLLVYCKNDIGEFEPVEYVFRRNGTFIKALDYDNYTKEKIENKNLGKYVR